MRIIAHIDMDAFFASVEERDRPYLKGYPIVIGSDPQGGKGRGVVSTANYPARKYGIRSAMPIREAWRRSEIEKKKGKTPVIFIEPFFRRYSSVSRQIFDTVKNMLAQAVSSSPIDDVFEQMGIDEAYLDLSKLGSIAVAEKFISEVRGEVRRKFDLPVSAGLGSSKLIAKIAGGEGKPDGFFSIEPGQEASFLAPLSADQMPGVGPKYYEVLKSKGFRMIGDIQKTGEAELERLFGKRGRELKALSLGIDSRPVSGFHEIQSIGEQETFPSDVSDLGDMLPRLYAMAGNIWKELKKGGFVGCRTIALTVRFANFSTKNRSRTFKEALRERRTFERFAVQLLLPFLDTRENEDGSLIRMIGLRAEKLEEC